MQVNPNTGEETEPEKANLKLISICFALLISGIALFLLLIYCKVISSKIIPPYSYYLIGIGICVFFMVLLGIIKALNTQSFIFANPYSVNIVKEERMIREILVLRTAGQIQKENNVQVDSQFTPTLNDAEKLAHKFVFEEGWGLILKAEMLLMNSVDDKDSLKARAELLLIESEKIKSNWRKKQIRTILGDDVDHMRDVKKDDLLRALSVKNDYYLTRSHKMNLHRVNVNILALLMVVVVIGILILSFIWNLTDLKFMDEIPSGQPKTNMLWKILVVSGLFGAFGAGFSYAKTLFSYDPELNKIPDQLLGMSVTIVRFIIGASAAIIIVLLVKSGFFSGIFSKDILNSPVIYIVLSFVAGFSERWVFRMIGLVTKEEEKE